MKYLFLLLISFSLLLVQVFNAKFESECNLENRSRCCWYNQSTCCGPSNGKKCELKRTLCCKKKVYNMMEGSYEIEYTRS